MIIEISIKIIDNIPCNECYVPSQPLTTYNNCMGCKFIKYRKYYDNK